MEKAYHSTKNDLISMFKVLFWFSVGAIIGLFFFISFVFIIFEKTYAKSVYPGIFVNGVNLGGKTKEEVINYFVNKNSRISNVQIAFESTYKSATISAYNLNLGYDSELLADQAYSVGRSDNTFSNINLILQAYINGIILSPSYTVSEKKVSDVLEPIAEAAKKDPIDALFKFENGKVVEFKTSADGQEADIQSVKNRLSSQIPRIVASVPSNESTKFIFHVPIKVVEPKITTEKVNSLGIKELIGTGTSLYAGSIESRMYNVTLAASRMNGVLVAPGETFSFVKTIGDVSSFTGYKQAYIIENGKTVLGDGGGVCQVSTTLFRAALNAGLPITERHAHAYRVHYYEEDSGPGLDATVYVPSVDFKFKNDTNHYILVQSVVEPSEPRLTFYFYGTKDGREITISEPIITSQTPAPEPLYQDDPTLPKGTVKQIDFAAAGAKTYFTRQVVKSGKTIIDEKFVSNFRPWQAVFLRGTKE